MSAALIPDRLASDTRMPLSVRLLVDLQRRGSAVDWTPALTNHEIAGRLQCSPQAIARALLRLVNAGYLERRRIVPRGGGRLWSYRSVIELTERQP